MRRERLNAVQFIHELNSERTYRMSEIHLEQQLWENKHFKSKSVVLYCLHSYFSNQSFVVLFLHTQIWYCRTASRSTPFFQYILSIKNVIYKKCKNYKQKGVFLLNEN